MDPAAEQAVAEREREQARKDRTSEYVVQIREANNLVAWRDLARVELPARAHRKSAVMLALADTSEFEPRPGMSFRVLDATAAEVLTLKERELPPVVERFEVVVEE